MFNQIHCNSSNIRFSMKVHRITLPTKRGLLIPCVKELTIILGITDCTSSPTLLEESLLLFTTLTILNLKNTWCMSCKSIHRLSHTIPKFHQHITLSVDANYDEWTDAFRKRQIYIYHTSTEDGTSMQDSNYRCLKLMHGLGEPHTRCIK